MSINAIFYGYNDIIGIRPALRIDLASLSGYVKDVGNENLAVKAVSWDTISFGEYAGNKLTWRVLNVNGSDGFLLSENIIENKKYNDGSESIIWKECALRAWLNSDFYNSAFTSDQKKAIKNTTIKNYSNPLDITSVGEDTSDNIFLLSLSEIRNSDYGFPDTYNCYSDTRKAYSIGNNNSSASQWWLRSPGEFSNFAAYVSYDGLVRDGGYDAGSVFYGVRPALHIDLSSPVWTKGNKVIAGDENALANLTTTANPMSTPTPTVSPTEVPPTVTPDQTVKPTEEPGEVPPTATPEPHQSTSISNQQQGVNNVTSVPQSTSVSTLSTTTTTSNNTSAKTITQFTVGNFKYKVVSDKTYKYAVYIIGIKNKKCKTITINSTVKYKKKKYYVTGIGKRFAAGCSKLKTINIKSKYIKKIEKKAFAGIKSKFKIYVLKSKVKQYTKMIKKSK